MAWSGRQATGQLMQKGQQQQKNYEQRGSTYSNSSSSPGIQKLESLKPGTNANVIGIIISKDSPRSIFSRKTPGAERHLISFVVRDSPSCFVHVTCWGNEQHITDISRSFIVGEVVKINKAQVQPKATDGSDEKFRPWTPLSVTLSLSENHSSLTHYDGQDLDTYFPLQYFTTKPSSDYYTLEDVQTNGQSLSGEHLNLLAAVRKIGEAKTITTKTGKHTKRCEVKLFDEMCQSFPLVLWGEGLADMTQLWSPLETVLFIADARINYDDFRSSMVATADSKTIFTANPDSVDARCLYQYAQTQSFPDEDTYQTHQLKDPPLDDIKEVLTVKDIVSRPSGKGNDYCILYAVITRFDLDSDNTEQFYRRRCSRCKQMVTQENGFQCSNTDCTLGTLTVFNGTGEVTPGEPELEFSISVSVTDHTGTISSCRLYTNVMEEMIGCKMNDLMALQPERRTEIKWRFLLERCKLYVKIQRNFKDDGKMYLRVLSCCLANPAELTSRLSA